MFDCNRQKFWASSQLLYFNILFELDKTLAFDHSTDTQYEYT